MIKLLFRIIFLFTVLLVLVFSPSANAAEIDDLQGKIVDGRFLVPMRSIFESLGASVEWDGATRTVTGFKDDVLVRLIIDDKYAVVNGKKYELDVPAQIINSRTYVPLRFISESLGADVNWDADNRLAIIVLKEVVLKVYEERQLQEPDQLTHYTLTMDYAGDGFGHTIPSYGTHKYEEGTVVEIKQDFSWTDPYSYLEYWEVNGHYTDAKQEPIIYVVMDSDKTVIAHWHFCPN